MRRWVAKGAGRSGRAAEIKPIFARAFAVVDAEEYPALPDVCQKVATADQQKAVPAPGATTGD